MTPALILSGLPDADTAHHAVRLLQEAGVTAWPVDLASIPGGGWGVGLHPTVDARGLGLAQGIMLALTEPRAGARLPSDRASGCDTTPALAAKPHASPCSAPQATPCATPGPSPLDADPGVILKNGPVVARLTDSHAQCKDGVPLLVFDHGGDPFPANEPLPSGLLAGELVQKWLNQENAQGGTWGAALPETVALAKRYVAAMHATPRKEPDLGRLQRLNDATRMLHQGGAIVAAPATPAAPAATEATGTRSADGDGAAAGSEAAP